MISPVLVEDPHRPPVRRACQRADGSAGQSSGARSPIELPASAPARSAEETYADQWLAAATITAHRRGPSTRAGHGTAGKTTPRLELICARHPETQAPGSTLREVCA